MPQKLLEDHEKITWKNSRIMNFLCRSALLSLPGSGWRERESAEEAAQTLGNMSSVALARKQHFQAVAFIELLQIIAEETNCMR